MCGRFEADYRNRELDRLLRALPPDSPLPRPGEVFPTNPALTLALSEDIVTPKVMAWGFPRWDGKGVIFNARAESALQKPMFRDSLRLRPVAVPVTGFFEWQKQPQKTSKFIFHAPEPVFYLAGFWNAFAASDQPQRFTILTTAANPAMRPYHHRMPVTLARTEIEPWLRGQTLRELLTREPPPLKAEPCA